MAVHVVTGQCQVLRCYQHLVEEFCMGLSPANRPKQAKVRKDLRRWLRELHERTGYTTVFVTHDQEEALELADRVVIMDRGCLEQVGTVDEVYEHPRTPFVFDFLGGTNVLDAEMHGRKVFLRGVEQPLVTDVIHPDGPADQEGQ
jgi:sulfate/thiosulfate transport system ATP-binding protein